MYRTAAGGRRAPDAIVLCRTCAASTSIVLEDAAHVTFSCEKCGTEQPALRDVGDFDPTKITFVSVGTGSYSELLDFGRTVGKDGQFAQITVACDAIPVTVSLSLNSGTVDGLEMVAAGDGLVPMRLVRERSMEREGKATGLLTEVQTGDASFDESVFIETASADGDVRTLLSAPGVRAAVLKLLDVAPAVVITADHIAIVLPLSPSVFAVAAIRERAGCLRIIAGAPRPLVASFVPLPPAAIATKIVAWTSLLIAVLAVVVGLSTYKPLGDAPYWVGLVSGLVLAAVLAPLIGRGLRGRSTSRREILSARVATFVSMPILAIGMLLIANGALDPSRERLVEMNVTSANDDSEAKEFDVLTFDADGASHRFRFSGTKPSGPARVRAHWRSGALGWTWRSGDTELLTGPAQAR